MSQIVMNNIPALRFPEFVHDGAWEEKTLGEVGTFIGGGTPNKAIQKYWEGTIPWISSSDIEDNNLYKISITRFITETAIKESTTKIVPRGSVLFVSRVGVGKIAINSEELCTSQDFTNFIPSLHTLNLYIGYYFFTKKDLLKSLNQGTSIQGFSKVDLEKIVIKIPSLAEQQKIAECLSSLDEWISAQTDKIDTLRQHKKGLLQQLFPTDGATVPALRFPEFVNDGDWEEKTLGEVCEMQAGKFVRATEISLNSNKNLYPCYGGNGLRGFTKSYTHTGKYSLVGRQGALCGNVTLVDGVFHATEHALVVFPNNGIDTVCLYYLLGYLNLNQFATGQAQPGLSVENLGKIKITLTPSQAEQQKIAECLSSLDEQIANEVAKLETLRQHKQGLLQQLFPSSK